MSSSTKDFNNLSLRDLIEARDMFHIHLTNKRNVIATAIGRYLIRRSDVDQDGNYRPVDSKSGKEKPPRTLANSMIINISWPCILVFITKWESKKSLIDRDASDILPKSLFMPDGRIIPICIVESEKSSVSDVNINPEELHFPENLIGGGFPVFIDLQGIRRVATLGCLVSDGHKYFGLTNKHVVGEAGLTIQSVLGGKILPVGTSTGRNLGKILFTSLYPGYHGSHVLVNCDAGLIEIENVNHWKTEILSIGEMDEMYDINTMNLSLNLLAEHSVKDGELQSSKKGNVVAYGAYSRRTEGEVCALFYRYRSLGGIEYVSDFLISGRNLSPLQVHHGDSGAIWHLEENKDDGKHFLPIALHWGQHELIQGKQDIRFNFSLATCLSNVCRELDVEIVRGWNLDQDYSWGKTGHYKIAARACDLVSNEKLRKLLQANKEIISYTDQHMLAGKMGEFVKGEFCALADVADLVWRYTRKSDDANHFADMDESHPAVMGGKTLFELTDAEADLSIDTWNAYYEAFEAADPENKKDDKRGALPFRIWQAFDLMVGYLKKGDVLRFIAVGGTVSHYLGDACQPLHASYLHHGRPGHSDETEVHSTFETTLLDKKMQEVLQGVNQKHKRKRKYRTYTTGRKAGYASVKLMREIVHNILPPLDIIHAVMENTGRGRYDRIWEVVGERAIDCMGEGALNLALFWESAWAAGGGDAKIKQADLVEMDKDALMQLYMDKEFFPSYRMKDPKFKKILK